MSFFKALLKQYVLFEGIDPLYCVYLDFSCLYKLGENGFCSYDIPYFNLLTRFRYQLLKIRYVELDALF